MEKVEIELKLHSESELAVKVSDDGDKEHAVWLPKSLITLNNQGNNVFTVTMPEWLAKDKGFI